MRRQLIYWDFGRRALCLGIYIMGGQSCKKYNHFLYYGTKIYVLLGEL